MDTMDKQDRHMPGEGMRVCLEVIIASLADQTMIRYCTIRQDISSRTGDPDDLVMQIIKSPVEQGQPTIPHDRCIIHSTSWRYEQQTTVVLTYLVYSDHTVFHNNSGNLLDLHHVFIPSSDDPARPRPETIEEHHVVSHGIRHICHLVQKNKNIHRILTAKSIAVFQRMEGHLAGRLC